MNTSHALQTGLRSLILIALTSVAAACGAAPEGQSTVDEKSLTDPSDDASDPDAAAPVIRAAPAPAQSLPSNYGSVPRDNGPGAPSGSGYVAPTHGPRGATRS